MPGQPFPRQPFPNHSGLAGWNRRNHRTREIRHPAAVAVHARIRRGRGGAGPQRRVAAAAGRTIRAERLTLQRPIFALATRHRLWRDPWEGRRRTQSSALWRRATGQMRQPRGRMCPLDVYRVVAALVAAPGGRARPELADLRAATRVEGVAVSRSESAIWPRGRHLLISSTLAQRREPVIGARADLAQDRLPRPDMSKPDCQVPVPGRRPDTAAPKTGQYGPA